MKFIIALLLINTTFATVQTAASAYYPHGSDSYQKVQDDLITLNTTASAVSTALNAKLSDLDANNSVDGINVERMVRFSFDTAVDGTAIAAYDVGQDLPAKAIITNSFCYTVTQFVDGGAGTVAISCEDANNILSAADLTGNAAGVMFVGAPKYSAPVAAITNACNITVTIAAAVQTAGKLNCWVKYVVHE